MHIDAQASALLKEFWPVILARIIGSDIPRLKKAQHSHWVKLFSGQLDPTYMQAVRRIELTHNKIGLEPRWYIGGYNHIPKELIELAISTTAGGAPVFPHFWLPLTPPWC